MRPRFLRTKSQKVSKHFPMCFRLTRHLYRRPDGITCHHKRYNHQYNSESITLNFMYKYYVSGHYPSSRFYLKHHPVYILKHNVSETGFCLRLHVKPTQLGSIDRAGPEIGTSSVDWAQLNRFYMKTETESSLRNVVFSIINKTMANVQKHNICSTVPSSQTFRSYSIL
jgi:hypothetical protein